MRRFLAILVCKLARWLGKRIGKGSSLPGKLALKVCPDILSRVRLPDTILAVTGSNGKTSTVEMIAAVLRSDGRDVAWNAEGSNQIEGVATLILSRADFHGRVRGDVLLLESDERYAARTFRCFHPTHFVITNLYRDQLTRNGHPESVYDALVPALSSGTELVLNADDPLVSCFARGRQHVAWFGLDRCAFSTDQPSGVYHDGAYCPLCGHPMAYQYAHYNHIGSYTCPNCGHHRQTPKYAATADLDRGILEIDGSPAIPLAFRSIYNVYNLLAADTVCRLCGVDPDTAARTLGDYVLKNGRVKTFRLGSVHGTLLTSKHENSIAYDTNLRYLAALDAPCTVLVIVDAVSRKYFTSETSWLWDIDFDLLNQSHIREVVLSGRYCNDLAERFSYTALPPEKWRVVEDIGGAAAELGRSDRENSENPGELYVVTCFSDRDKFLCLTEQEG